MRISLLRLCLACYLTIVHVLLAETSAGCDVSVMNDSYTEVACVVIVDNGRGKFQATVEPGQPVGETPRSTH